MYDLNNPSLAYFKEHKTLNKAFCKRLILIILIYFNNLVQKIFNENGLVKRILKFITNIIYL